MRGFLLKRDMMQCIKKAVSLVSEVWAEGLLKMVKNDA